MAAPKIKPGQSSDASIKHVSPYPIPVRITKTPGQAPVAGQIVKLTDVGFLMKVDSNQFYKVADHHQFNFELPAIHHFIDIEGIVVKTYDAFEGGGRGKVRTIEIHFRALSDADRMHLNTYLVKSGQKKS